MVGNGNGGGAGTCASWVAGDVTMYLVISLTFNGNNYICVNENPGYDPVVSSWFWDRTSASCGSGSGGNGSSGNNGGGCPAWSTDGNYLKGNIVSYQGKNYLCKNDNPGYDPIVSTWFWEQTSSGCSKSATADYFKQGYR